MGFRAKSVMVLSAAALTFTMLAPGTAQAAAPVDASGTLHCDISGIVKVAPKLTFGGQSAGGSLLLAKVNGTCSGTSGVTSVKGKLMARLPTNDCIALATTPFPVSDFGPLKFKGAGKYTKSSVHFTGGEFGTSDPVTLTLPGSGNSSSIASGSFAGQTATMTLVMNETTNDFATACGPKQKGVKNSGGLKKMTFGTTSSFDIS